MIIDGHIHLYDPRRPQGVPYPSPDRKAIFRPMLPRDIREVAQPVGVDGVVAVECSHWLEDNQWLLQQAAEDPFVCAVIGNLDIESADFSRQLGRFMHEPIFRGVRLRWPGRPFDFKHPRLRPNLDEIAGRRGVVELIVRGAELEPTAALARDLPGVRFMLDHLATGPIAGGKLDSAWAKAIEPFANLPNVHCKVSHFTESAERRPAPLDLEYYAPTLDHAWHVFGADRLVWGSDWPPCLEAGDYCATATLTRDFFAGKGDAVRQKVMARNAAAFYGGPRFTGRN